MKNPPTDIHVIPQNDLKAHEDVRQCWCRPRIDEDGLGPAVVIHHAADGREYWEEDYTEESSDELIH